MELEIFKVNEILPPLAGRQISEKALEKLKASILKVGILNPPLVRMENGKPRLVDGEHRITVMRELGWRMVVCYVLTSALESVHQVQATDGDLGRQLQRLRDQGYTINFLIEKLQMTEERINYLLSCKDEA